jgi:chromosome segregation protein
MRQRAVSLKQVEDQWSQLQERLAQSLQRRSSVREALSLLAHGLERGVEAREPGERLAVEVAELGGELRAAEERLKALNATLDAATRQILALGEDQKHERAAATDVEDAVRRAEDGASQCTKDLEQTETHWGRLQATLAELSQKRSAVSQRAFHIRDAEKKAAAAEEELSARLHQSELHLTRLELRLEAVEQRLVNEFGAGRSISSIVGAAHTNQPQEAETSQNALLSESQETPADAVPADFDRSKAEKEMALLKEELNLLGEVNLGSVYHYDRLAARKASLLEQSLDLEQGKESLRKAVQEIDRRTKSQFLSAFRKAGEEFQRLFQGLFGGGQTELLLTDPTDLLETGVEIKVRLPGKEMVNLLLLSGGEKSLTAIAFLFSLMAVRPSPFCLLDEVDAALDEPNSRKFSSLLQEMRDRTQFLVITHNPLTMESADYLYGVTLGDSGASRLLSVSLADGNGNGRRQHAPAT